MPQINGAPRDRSHEIRRPSTIPKSEAFAERFFTDRDQAFDYYQQRQRELAPRRVQLPIPSEEDDGVWVVEVELAS